MLQIMSGVILAIFLVVAVDAVRRRLSKASYPPGPKGLPLIGSIFTTFDWSAYQELSRQYNSDIIHLNFLGSHLIVLNSGSVASDILDKRSAIYSDRPRFPMITELMGWDVMSVYPYGDKWRTSRRLFDHLFDKNILSTFQPKIIKATYEMMHRLVHTPDEFMNHSRLWAGSIILDITYGIDAQPVDDMYLGMVETAMNSLKIAGNPGSFLVDVFPILKYVPEWVPGAGFQKRARIWKKEVEDCGHIPLEYVKKQMAMGTHSPSMTSTALEELEFDDDPKAQAEILSTTLVTFSGGTDSVVSTLNTFFLAMVLNPHVVKKAQEELDMVIGPHRLPELSDMPSLPYINAIIKEIQRWHPPLALGVVHRLMEDDVYEDYFFPAGTLVLGNIAAILRDENVYKDPNSFNPERFLEDGQLVPSTKFPNFAFGFGRRFCPGRLFAETVQFLTIANILSTFDITYAKDEDGKIIIPSGEYTSGSVVHPKPFKCSIKPRSSQAVELINEACSAYRPLD